MVGDREALSTSQPELKVVTEELYEFDARDHGIQLYVRDKSPEGVAQFSGEKTLLYVHGTTQTASGTFDLPLDGFSWMDYVAHHGYMLGWLICGATVVPSAT